MEPRFGVATLLIFLTAILVACMNCEATLGGAQPRAAWEMMIHNRLESQSLMTRIGITSFPD